MELSGQPSQRGSDWDEVTRLLGRTPAGAFSVVVRRPAGSPVVIENAPLLDDGRPMPTRYWLVDAAVREAVSRLEAAGGVRRATTAVPQTEVAAAHSRYAEERDHTLPRSHSGPRPSGGVGGTRQGVKCLHAHLAWYLAGGDDPVGAWTAEQLGVSRDDFVLAHPGTGGIRRSVGVVDCGTNSTRLIVVAPDGTVLQREMRITRLGEGVDATHAMAPAAIDRTLRVLRDYRSVMDDRGVGRTRVVATSAARDAHNAEEFMARAAGIMGVRPEVLSGDEEGRYSFDGATAHLPTYWEETGRVLVVDIGGGSTELAAGYPPSDAGHGAAGVATRSLDIGCVRVTERFLSHDPPRRDELAAARAAVADQLALARGALPALLPEGLLVGLAGTVSTLACLQLGAAVYDRNRIHHTVLWRDDIERWLHTLARESAKSRLAHPGMIEGREDVIVGGAVVLAEVMVAFDRASCLVSEDDILDGLAADLLRRDVSPP